MSLPRSSRIALSAIALALPASMRVAIKPEAAAIAASAAADFTSARAEA